MLQSEELRYERKFLIKNYNAKEIVHYLKLHPACFNPIFQERQINNIYFDTLDFKGYYDNVDGNRERKKIRIRWYGELFGNITHPVLEFKIKKGLLGKKDSYQLGAFTLNRQFSESEIYNALSHGNVPKQIADILHSVKPAILNSYIRQYFISFDKKYRITIDRNISYYGISYNQNTFLNKKSDTDAVVLELKYDSKYEHLAGDIATCLPFSMTKNSKYLQGIEQVLF